jgi:hypothetical protein
VTTGVGGGSASRATQAPTPAAAGATRSCESAA